jgi:cytosolic 5'-nucleotidase 3
MHDKNIIIINEEKLEAVKRKMIADGPEKLQVLSDFDKTLTKNYVNGEKIVSFTSILRDENFFTPEYSKLAYELFNRYQPLEMDLTIPLKEKQKLMHEWWSKHYELMTKFGLTKKDLQTAAKSKRLLLRDGVLEMFEFLHDKNIPLVILSASGIGIEAIQFYFEKYDKLYDNIHIVSNEFIWDDNGLMTGYKEPIIHSFDKDYSAVKDFPFYEDLKNRKNILLLGDIINDTNMVNDFAYDNLIKIGFLNEADDKMLEEYKKVFDVIILNDGTAEYINILLKELV